ncbi:hypothetical protein E4U55_005227 [Claviceps digitariae]|nr:hypothetical protein E4U55_005227 [Claviceps digitariae]
MSPKQWSSTKTMGTILDTFVPFNAYNALPFINQVAAAPDDHSQDLQDLRDLLNKHNVPAGVSIRLIHKHFDAAEGEIMVFNNISLPKGGIVQVMKPALPSSSGNLRGIHYFVNDDGALQAYEYGNCDIPDMAGSELFLAEFCRLVSDRGLQHKFGLKLRCEHEADQTAWTEYELHANRCTIMFPDAMSVPVPDGHDDSGVTTEWPAIANELPRNCKHSTVCSHGPSKCKHCRHCMRHSTDTVAEQSLENGFCLGGQNILPGDPVYDIVHQVIAAC